MKRLALILALIAAPAFAEDGPIVLVDSTVCANAVEYKPGVDVNGRPVVSADLDDDADYGDELGESVAVTLKMDLASQLGIPTGMLTSDAQIGTLTRDAGGTLLLNGKPLRRPSAVELAALCRQNGQR